MNKKLGILIAGALICIGIAIAVFVKGAGGSNTAITRTEGASTEKTAAQSGDYLTVDGQKYKYNSDIKAILFLGVDRRGDMSEEAFAGSAGQADCILLLAMDTVNKTTTVIQISRETMIDVKTYDISGNYVSTENMQICLQYGYGDGGKKSCWMMKNVVSDLFFGLSISSCIAMDIDGISSVTDAIGGVTLTPPEDYTMIDERLTQGTEVTLDGALAERYVRYRDTEVTGSNNGRMQRQTQFLRAMISQIQGKIASDASMLNTVFSVADPYMTSDSSVDELKKLSDYTLAEDIITVPGETVEGAKHDEYMVNYAEFEKIYLDLFYKKV